MKQFSISTWRCPECKDEYTEVNYKWMQQNGTPVCDCGEDMYFESERWVEQEEKLEENNFGHLNS